MDDKIEQQHNRTTQEKTADNPLVHRPEFTPTAYKRIEAASTQCYVIGGLMVSIGGVIGITSPYYNWCIALCLFGSLIVAVGIILQRRATANEEVLETLHLTPPERNKLDEIKELLAAQQEKPNEDGSYIAERAYLNLENMQITAFKIGKRFAFTFNIQNRGLTPAYNVRIAIRRMDVTLTPNLAPRNPDLVLKELAKGAWAESMASHTILPGHPSTANSNETEIISKSTYDQWRSGTLERWIGVQVKFTDIRGDKERSIVVLNVYSKETGLTVAKTYTTDTANIISKP